MSNFTKWNLAYKIFQTLPIFSKFLWNLIFIFLGSHKKFSLVLLHITNYIYSTWKMKMLFKVFVYWKLKLLNFLMDFVLTSHVHIQPSLKLLVVNTKETDQSKCLHFRDVLFSWDQVYFKGFSGSLISSLIIFREWWLTSLLLWIGRFTWSIVIFSHVSAVQNKSLTISC